MAIPDCFDVFVATNIQTRIVSVDACFPITWVLWPNQVGCMHASISTSSRSFGDSDKPLPCTQNLFDYPIKKATSGEHCYTERDRHGYDGPAFVLTT
jgi:hypothetical protein